MFEARRIVRFPSAGRPILVVVVDTEEEFDWAGGFDRDAIGVTSVREIWRVQELFDQFGIRPTYVVDYPVAAEPDNVAVLRGYLEAGRAEIGLQMHPWVNPPFEEALTPANSYQGNLGPELERRKLEVLIETVRSTFRIEPVVHKAGRYGFGPNTADILDQLDLKIDLSACPGFDFSRDGGPDYTQVSADVFWFGPNRDLLGIPTTAGFVGRLQAAGPRLYPLFSRNGVVGTGMRGLLARFGVLERMRLSPEGHSAPDIRKLTRALLDDGLRVFSFSFHSPSMKPGCTPYVQTEQDLADFLDNCRRYFDFFLGELGGVAMTPAELRRHLLDGEPPGPAERWPSASQALAER